MEPFYREFGARVRAARGDRLSQTQLARQIGMSRGSIANIEVGRQRIPLHLLAVLARALGVEPASLLPDPSIAAIALIPPDRIEQLHALDVSALEKVVRRARATRRTSPGQA